MMRYSGVAGSDSRYQSDFKSHKSNGKVIQTNAALAEDSAPAPEELSAQAQTTNKIFNDIVVTINGIVSQEGDGLPSYGDKSGLNKRSKATRTFGGISKQTSSKTGADGTGKTELKGDGMTQDGNPMEWDEHH